MIFLHLTESVKHEFKSRSLTNQKEPKNSEFSFINNKVSKTVVAFYTIEDYHIGILAKASHTSSEGFQIAM